MTNRLAAGLTVSLAAVALAGCAASSQTSFSAASTAEQPELEGTPIEHNCDTLFDPSFLDYYSQDLVLNTSFEPTPDSNAQIAVEMGGIACEYTGSDGSKFLFTLAEPSAQTRAYLIDQISLTSEPVSGRISPAFFTPGDFEEFPLTYWVSYISSDFEAVDDVDFFESIVGQALPSA